MRGVKFWGVAGAALALVAVLVCWLRARPEASVPPVRTGFAERSPAAKAPAAAIRDRAETADGERDAGEVAEAAGEDETEAPQTEEEKREAEEEAKVEAFDALTDRWQEPSKTGVTMDDVERFVASFRSVPKDRKDECIHRALNLVPDENVMLLAGVLMDKTEDKDIVDTVFSDILNRDEGVKKPILRQIYEDRAHPCWADVAWIFDVTGEGKSE